MPIITLLHYYYAIIFYIFFLSSFSPLSFFLFDACRFATPEARHLITSPLPLLILRLRFISCHLMLISLIVIISFLFIC